MGVKNAMLFCVPLFMPALYLAGFIAVAFISQEIYQYIYAEALIPEPFLHLSYPSPPTWGRARIIFGRNSERVRIDSCPI